MDSLPETSVGIRACANAANVGQGPHSRHFKTAIWATHHWNVYALAKMITLDPPAKDLAVGIYGGVAFRLPGKFGMLWPDDRAPFRE